MHPKTVICADSVAAVRLSSGIAVQPPAEEEPLFDATDVYCEAGARVISSA